uniref:Conotoxin Lt6.4 n=1 Tax=Conus litteratus TaxID=89445 RepID=I364_CONLT|nr:RecName: Full=Conotoxin Lt6.4; Flags: Precursor [Conus litteratus]ACU30046.1 conotoxin 6.1 [Conus litteratus]
MKLVLAIVLILMFLSLSAGAETSDNGVSRGGHRPQYWPVTPPSIVCLRSGEDCENNTPCCPGLSCRVSADLATLKLSLACD